MTYLPRLVDGLLDELLAGVPAVLVVGPRACGKTTSARRHVRDMLRLDRPSDADLVRADPDLALRAQAEPLLIDEWQLVPEVLGAIKRSVDDGTVRAGFAARSAAERTSTQHGLGTDGPDGGRLALDGPGGAAGDVGPVRAGARRRPALGVRPRPARRGRRRCAATAAPSPRPPRLPRCSPARWPAGGGLQPDVRLRRRRLASYVDEIVARDGALLDGSRDPVRLRRYLQAVAANTAGVVEHRTLFEAAEINRATAVGYDGMLAALLVVDSLPAWSTNRLSRLTSRPKRHLVEPALVGPLLGIDASGVLRDPDMLGRLMESFVVARFVPS